jgi:predicted small secreted protein
LLFYLQPTKLFNNQEVFMKKSLLLPIAFATALLSGCATMSGNAGYNDVNTDLPSYGSADTNKNSITIAGRDYQLRPAEVAPVKVQVYQPAQFAQYYEPVNTQYYYSESAAVRKTAVTPTTTQEVYDGTNNWALY